MASKVLVNNISYPRIGANREWKWLLENFWNKKVDQKEFLSSMKEIRINQLKEQLSLGVDLLPVGNFTHYDHVLDTAAMFNIIPKRYLIDGKSFDKPIDLDTYFAMARGNSTVVACEMTKFFNTNYHYIVPEYERSLDLKLLENRPLEAYREAIAEKIPAHQLNPVIIGPYTLAKFSKGDVNPLNDYVNRLLPLYVELLKQLSNEGCKRVQIEEPMLVKDLSDCELNLVKRIYLTLNSSVPDVAILLQTYFDSIEKYDEIIKLPVAGIGLDLYQGLKGNLENLDKFGFPSDKTLALGVVNGRNIWRVNLKEKYQLIDGLVKKLRANSTGQLLLQSSCPLFLSPITTKCEDKLPSQLLNGLSFSMEKLTELKTLANAINGDINGELFDSCEKDLAILDEYRLRNKLQDDYEKIINGSNDRSEPFNVRYEAQQKRFNFTLLPTTTIGSFPQDPALRATRLSYKTKKISEEEYVDYINKKIQFWIDFQQELGIDIYVHGEPERNDMVEYFGERLDGFSFTKNGWVQSYGSRCVKPPIIYGNVNWTKPMTLREAVYAQSLTKKPVKGMLTGPVTILNWSFPREDIPRQQVAYQIGVALRNEVSVLQDNNIGIIQVDEPAVREGLPLKFADQTFYLDWSVKAFKISVSTAKPSTQIHTHMCYSDFEEIIDSISALDADVISIESSRSHGETITSFEKTGYSKGIGLGVYDIHSPRIPPVEEMYDIIKRALKIVDKKYFWVNPDCGLKTRKLEETRQALKNMIEATQLVRKELN